MRETAIRMGDAMLRRILPRAVAGACIGQYGQVCKCADCQPGGTCSEYRVSCTGQCLKTISHCTP
jgi:hypothetical protein